MGMVDRQGAQGILDGASKAMLENEFGTHKEEDVVEQILEKGEIHEATVCLFHIWEHALGDVQY